MEDEKFEKIMDDWASREIKSTPQLRPKKKMYQMLKAKKRKVFFPVFARWATVGIATAMFIVAVTLYPDIFRPSTHLEQSIKEEEASVELQKEDVAKKNAPGFIREKTEEPVIVRRTLDESVLRDQKETEEGAITGETVTVKAPLPMAESAADSPVGQVAQPAPTAPTAKLRAISETRKRKAKVVSTRETLQRMLEEEFDSGTSSRDDQVTAPEPLISGKDTPEEKQADSKLFRVKNGIWTDAEHSQEKELIKIKRNSQAYHDLITAMPDLKAYFEIGQNVIVNVGDYSIEMVDDGKTELTEDELKKLVK